MAYVDFVRGNTEKINETDIKDGQLLFNIDEDTIQMDNGNVRKVYGSGNAKSLTFDNSSNNMNATNVQDAIDELKLGKQNKLPSQTPYTKKGSESQIPQITTNALGQVTNISEVSVTIPTVDSELDETSTNAIQNKAVFEAINSIEVVKSHIGMIIHSTTLNTEEKVKAIYGGESWSKLEGVFLIGANSTYQINATGGSATNTLSVANLPAHYHSVNAFNSGTQSANHNHTFNHTHSIVNNGGHQHNTAHGYLNVIGAQGSHQAVSTTYYAEDPYSQNVTSWNGDHGHSMGNPSPSTTGNNNQNHSHSVPSHNTNNTGSGTAVNNLPPYKAVYIWERTA